MRVTPVFRPGAEPGTPGALPGYGQVLLPEAYDPPPAQPWAAPPSERVPDGTAFGADDDDLATLLRGGRLRSLLQPLVDLRSQNVVAHEALLRGPAGSALESPQALIDAARASGDEAELDRVALRTHLLGAGHSAGTDLLFVNVEPSTVHEDPDAVLQLLRSRPPGLRVVVELAERALAREPAAVLAAADRLRDAGHPIALDDVGAEPAALALLPVLRPEVVKLDVRRLGSIDDLATVVVTHAVRAYAEQSGALVVAEGIESEEDRARALVLGAVLGQGWLWGRPQALANPSWSGSTVIAAPVPREQVRQSPFALLGPDAWTGGPESVVRAVARGIEVVAQESGSPPVLLSCVQDVRHLDDATIRRLGVLAERLPLVAVLGTGVSAEPAPRVRGASLPAGDPLAEEWTVVVLGVQNAVALLARERPAPPGSGEERWFDFAVTQDRTLVVEGARRLLDRLDIRFR